MTRSEYSLDWLPFERWRSQWNALPNSSPSLNPDALVTSRDQTSYCNRAFVHFSVHCTKMLLPYSINEMGQFQPKPWPLYARPPLPSRPAPLGNAFCSLSPIRNAIGPHFPLAPPFHSLISHSALQRPPLQQSLPALFVPPCLNTAVGHAQKRAVTLDKGALQKKKFKIFRPWDDEAKIPAIPTPCVDIHCGGQSIKNQCPVGVKLNELKDDTTKQDDLERSKSAFEIFATNLGKSMDGHRCIYCGKIYSRKYGLKIHLRTHTGFKPLKCKVCQRPFGDPSNLNKHVRLHADVLLASDQFASSSQKRDGEDALFSSSDSCGTSCNRTQLSIFRCPFCTRTLVRKRDLERHIASRHSNEHFVDVERE